MHGEQMSVGIIGATNLVGQCLLPLLAADCRVIAFSDQPRNFQTEADNIVWRYLDKSSSCDLDDADSTREEILQWVSLGQIWVLPDYFPMLQRYGIKRIVALSSTSRFVKILSCDPTERSIAEKLADGEDRLMVWAETNKIEWTILRPTLIYGLAGDKNIVEIARFIRRFSFFPLFGHAGGLRQPVHCQDIAACCFSALNNRLAINKSYNVSGGEVLTFREMVLRVFKAMGKSPRFIKVPLWIFKTAIGFIKFSKRFRHWSFAMAKRTSEDLVFDHSDAARELGFNPRPFTLTSIDLPR